MGRIKEQVKADNDMAVLRARLLEIDREIEDEEVKFIQSGKQRPSNPFQGWTPKMEQLLQEQERLMGTR